MPVAHRMHATNQQGDIVARRGERAMLGAEADASVPVGASRPESSTAKVLGILDLFTVHQPMWTAEMLMEQLGLSRATAYRYLRELSDNGFVAPAAGGGYILGPRFIELDRQIRLVDPLLQVAPAIVDEYRERVGGVIVLCRFYGDRVVSVYSDQIDPDFALQMERGRPLPILFGAPSRIIVAYLTTYQLRNLMLHHADEIAEAGLGNNWREFRAKLKAIRAAGCYVSAGLGSARVSASAPIFSAPNTITASICLARRESNNKEQEDAEFAEWAMEAGERISTELQRFVADSVDGASFAGLSKARLGRQ
jgi:DNA-binding IclR family transcriptional regulator